MSFVIIVIIFTRQKKREEDVSVWQKTNIVTSISVMPICNGVNLFKAATPILLPDTHRRAKCRWNVTRKRTIILFRLILIWMVTICFCRSFWGADVCGYMFVVRSKIRNCCHKKVVTKNITHDFNGSYLFPCAPAMQMEYDKAMEFCFFFLLFLRFFFPSRNQTKTKIKHQKN